MTPALVREGPTFSRDLLRFHHSIVLESPKKRVDNGLRREVKHSLMLMVEPVDPQNELGLMVDLLLCISIMAA